jgi:hypothetical protein
LRPQVLNDAVTVAFREVPEIGPGIEAGRFDIVLRRSL